MANKKVPLKWVSQMIQIFNNTIKEYNASNDQIKICDNKLTDIEHYIEMANFNASEGYKLSKQIKDIRVLRREHKEIVYLFEPVYELFNKHKHFFDELRKCQGEVQRRMNKLDNKAYVPRTTHLEEAFKKAAEAKGIRLIVNNK